MRRTLITEMIQSERDYARDLKICADNFIYNNLIRQQLEKNGIILESIFRNLDEVISVSDKLTTLLEEKNLCKRPENQLVGQCFIEIFDEISQAYLVYCRDHEESRKAWTKAEENPQVRPLFQSALESIKSESNCFDVPSILIKPVQRILKYPLLLQELVKFTEESHQDYQQSITAANMMTELAHEINEKKRQKELVYRYKKDAHNSLTSKISRISFHSMRKKGSRINVQLKSSLGLAILTKDPKFDEEYEKFKCLKKTVELFLKDLNTFVLSYQDLVNAFFQLSEDIAAYYADKCRQQEVEEFRTSQRLVKTEYFEDFKKTINSKITSILQQLLNKFQNPSKLIDKRHDKLLDFEAAAKRSESNRDQSRFKALKEEENMAKHNYEALNSKLIADLPVFIASSVKVLQNCIGAFMRIKKIFLGKTTNQIMRLLELPGSTGSAAMNSNEVISETFDIKFRIVLEQMNKEFPLVREHLEDLTPCTKSLMGTLSRRKEDSKRRLSTGSVSGTLHAKNENKYQDEFNRAAIRQSYRGNIYRVKRDYKSAELASISVHQNDIVGVIKYKDPSGNPHLWFVDNGIDQGLLPEAILTPAEGTTGPPPIQTQPTQTLTANPNSSQNLSTSRSISRSAPPVPNLNVKDDQSHVYYLPPDSSSAAYSHSSTNDNCYSNAAAINENPSDHFPPTYDEVTETAQNLEANMSIFGDSAQASANSSYEATSSSDSTRYANIEEFDPLASSSPINRTTNSADTSSQEESRNTSSELDDSGPDQRPLVLRNYQAAYQFTPQGPHQLALFQGEIVMVKYGSDTNGNTEWFFVRNRNCKEGYVPANYLTPCS